MSDEELRELYRQAIAVVIQHGRATCKMLQIALGVGYGRAAWMIDQMDTDGIVGSYPARECLIVPPGDRP